MVGIVVVMVFSLCESWGDLVAVAAGLFEGTVGSDGAFEVDAAAGADSGFGSGVHCLRRYNREARGGHGPVHGVH